MTSEQKIGKLSVSRGRSPWSTGLFLMTGFILSGCVTWYTGEPDRVAVVAAKQPVDIHYSVRSISSNNMGGPAVPVPSPEHLRGVRKAIELSGLFRTNLQHPSLADYQDREKGKTPIFLDVSIMEGNPGGGQIAWAYFDTLFFAALLPAYWSSELTVECSLYRYNTGANTYEKVDGYTYDTKRRTIYWLPALVAVWANAITGDPPEIVELAVLDYLHRVSKSGIL